MAEQQGPRKKVEVERGGGAGFTSWIGYIVIVLFLLGGGWWLLNVVNRTGGDSATSTVTTITTAPPLETPTTTTTTVPPTTTTTVPPTTTTTVPPTTTTTVPPTTTTTVPVVGVSIQAVCELEGTYVWGVLNTEGDRVVYMLASPADGNMEGPITAVVGESQVVTQSNTVALTYDGKSQDSVANGESCESLTAVDATAVRIFNGTGGWNLAKRWQSATDEIGYRTSVDNWPDFGVEVTRIEYAPGYQAHAENLRSRLYGFVTELTPKDIVGDGRTPVAVVLGSDAPDSP